MNDAPAHHLLYASANGDRWLLVLDTPDGTPVVRHVANRASSGQVTDADVVAFLQRDRGSPQHQALWQYLSELLQRKQGGGVGR